VTEQAASRSRADTRLYQVVHKTFRVATTRLITVTEKLEPSALQPIIGAQWSFYEAVLHDHHRTEDTIVFPALLAVRPDMDTLVEKLEDEHRQLIPAMDTASAAVTSFEHQPDTVRQKTMLDDLIAIRELFFPHLDVEDAQILPAIAESIPRKEWERLDKQALKSIPRQHLPKAVGALDEIIQGLPEEERPPPPPLPIRVMLAVSWRRKWTEWRKPLLVS